MKKWFTLFLLLMLLLSLAACGAEEAPPAPEAPGTAQKDPVQQQPPSGDTAQEGDFTVPEIDPALRATDLKITELKTGKKLYAPGEGITVTLKWTGTPDSSAWVGIIPADVPHGDEYVNDDADVAYIYLDGHEGDQFVFDDELSAPLTPGLYTIRVNENDGGGAELAWCAFAVVGTGGQQQSAQPSEPAADDPAPAEGDLTVADFLSHYGFAEADITPAHFLSFEPVRMDGGDPGDIGSTGFLTIALDGTAATREDYDPWFDTLWAKMTELSADGKIYKSYLMDTEATPLSDLQAGALWELMPGFGPCFYQYNHLILALTARYDAQKGHYSMSISVWGPAA